ncbi:MAG: hypothetical protein IJB27_03465 [Clostridia bacterium]|nr:hypothetical protein [Clostridia bacterium]
MPICTTTTYTAERVEAYLRFAMPLRWILKTIVLVCLLFAKNYIEQHPWSFALKGVHPSSLDPLLWIVGILLVMEVVRYTLLVKVGARNKRYDRRVETVTFWEDHAEVDRTTAMERVGFKLSYSEVRKVGVRGDNLFILFKKGEHLIVDLTANPQAAALAGIVRNR